MILESIVIGRADPESAEAGKLSLLADFPNIFGDLEPFGATLGEVQTESWWRGSAPVRTVGRHAGQGSPDDGQLFWVDASELPLMTRDIVSAGVISTGGVRMGGVAHACDYSPPDGSVPYVGIVGAKLAGISVAQAIHTSTTYRILSAWPHYSQDETPPSLVGWGPFDPFSAARWADIRNPLVNAMDVDADLIDGWWSTHGEDATPVEFVRAVIAAWRRQ